MKKNIYIGLVLLFLVGLLYVFTQAENQERVLAAYGLDDLTVTELIEKLENDSLPDNVSASVYHDHMNLYIDNKLYTYRLPSDVLYISFAPYYNYTHDCYFHSLTGCVGEMVDEDIIVRLYDEDDNLIEETIKSTGHDGFIGLFLTSNVEYRIEIEHEGLVKSFSVQALTDQTCYTGMRFR